MLEALHRSTPESERGLLVRVAAHGDRVTLFERRTEPLTRVVLYTLSGPDAHESNLRRVLESADAVVLVVGSDERQIEEAGACLARLDEWLRVRGRDPGELELFLEYNQRDRPDAVPVSALNARLNRGGAAWGEAVATRGEGVSEAFARVLEALRARPRGRRAEDAAGPDSPRAPAAPAADRVPIPIDAGRREG